MFIVIFFNHRACTVHGLPAFRTHGHGKDTHLIARQAQESGEARGFSAPNDAEHKDSTLQIRQSPFELLLNAVAKYGTPDAETKTWLARNGKDWNLVSVRELTEPLLAGKKHGVSQPSLTVKNLLTAVRSTTLHAKGVEGGKPAKSDDEIQIIGSYDDIRPVSWRSHGSLIATRNVMHITSCKAERASVSISLRDRRP